MNVRGSLKCIAVLLWSLFSWCLCQKNGIGSFSFHKPPGCRGQRPKSYQVSQVVNSTSMLDCVSTCAWYAVCNSIVFDRVNKTCYLSQQPAAEDCLNMQDTALGWVYLEKKNVCKNGGIPRGDSCGCAAGYIGETCEIGPMRDFYDYYSTGNSQGSTALMIRPLDSLAFSVNCFNGATTVMTRRTNQVNFTRPWRDYRDGFGDLNDTHWLGLEKLHIMTSQNRTYQLRVQAALKNGTVLQVTHPNVRIKDENSLYQLTFDSVKPDPIGDCLADLRGANFSTYDNDNDENNNVNCAGRHQGGWWFRGNTCSTCNPTGQLLQPANGLRTGVDSEVFWITYLGDVVPYKIHIRLVYP